MLLIVYSLSILMVYDAVVTPKPGAIAIIVLYLVFASICLFGIRYQMDDKTLVIRNGFFGKTFIDIGAIRKIERTWNLISSPAPSVTGRVEIHYNHHSIVISPKNFNDFKEALLKINPAITVKA